MARVTVEDCIDKVDNRFELVLLASHRARMISSGSPLTVDRDNDKNPVVALREVAESSISPQDLKEDLIHSLQKYVEVDEPEQPEAVAGSDRRAGRCPRGRRRWSSTRCRRKIFYAVLRAWSRPRRSKKSDCRSRLMLWRADRLRFARFRLSATD